MNKYFKILGLSIGILSFAYGFYRLGNPENTKFIDGFRVEKKDNLFYVSKNEGIQLFAWEYNPVKNQVVEKGTYAARLRPPCQANVNLPISPKDHDLMEDITSRF